MIADSGAEKLVQGHKERKIITIASFCFAVVSWAATAEGMQEYVFTSGIEAGLISFGIQSILFAFNLRLPYFVENIGRLTPNTKREVRNDGSYKWTIRQKLVAVFYFFILLSSSFFSFVYICNSVIYGRDTGYIDDNTVLQYEYEQALEQTQKAVDESMKALPLIASAQLANLQQEMIVAGIMTEGQKSLDDLKLEEQAALQTYEDKQQVKESALREYEDNEEDFNALQSVMLLKADEYEKAKEARDTARDALNKASAEETTAKSAYDAAKEAVINYKPSSGILVSTVLTELLKTNPDTNNVETAMSELVERIIELGETNAIPNNYAQIVENVQSVNTTIARYMDLCGTTEVSAKSRLEELEKTIINKTTVPNPQAESFQADMNMWRAEWKEKYSSLQEIVLIVPQYSQEELANLSDAVIDIKMLKDFDSEKILNSMNETMREKLTDINVMERASLRLFRKYSLTAWMSFVIAFGLDISSFLAGVMTYWMEKAEGLENVESVPVVKQTDDSLKVQSSSTLEPV